jgi:hypothetical protein
MPFVSLLQFMRSMKVSTSQAISLTSKSTARSVINRIPIEQNSFSVPWSSWRSCSGRFKPLQGVILSVPSLKSSSPKVQKIVSSRWIWWLSAHTVSCFISHSHFLDCGSSSRATSFTDTFLEMRATLNTSLIIHAKFFQDIWTTSILSNFLITSTKSLMQASSTETDVTLANSYCTISWPLQW